MQMSLAKQRLNSPAKTFMTSLYHSKQQTMWRVWSNEYLKSFVQSVVQPAASCIRSLRYIMVHVTDKQAHHNNIQAYRQ